METDNGLPEAPRPLSGAERINVDPFFPEIPSEPQVPSEREKGGGGLKLHYFQVDGRPWCVWCLDLGFSQQLPQAEEKRLRKQHYQGVLSPKPNI